MVYNLIVKRLRESTDTKGVTTMTEENKKLFGKIFNEFSAAICSVLAKYNGKKCGEKTRGKISKELTALVPEDKNYEMSFNRYCEWVWSESGKYKCLVAPAKILVAIYDTNSNGERYCKKAFSIWAKNDSERDSLLDNDNVLIAPKTAQDLYFGKWVYDAD